MNISQTANNALIVRLPNEIYLEQATILREELFLKITNESEVLFDFSNVEYIDSSGIGVLVAIQKRVKSFKIKGIYGSVKELFELTKMDRLFEYVE